ncbi:hypothetical protein ACFC1T_09530 [Kitasatospora sp. NPDC056076]|uniref:hypothetical protein n=1 Tax=Kitasatospora sp. NPDC056076 TaxID=3345703 RepID=UPI0035DF4837
MDLEGRSGAVQDVAVLFSYDHHRDPGRRAVARIFHDAAAGVLAELGDSEGLVVVLRRLLEANREAVQLQLTGGSRSTMSAVGSGLGMSREMGIPDRA